MSVNRENILQDVSDVIETLNDEINNSDCILQNFLTLIDKVNFRELAELKDDKAKLQKKNYLVSTIEVLLEKINKEDFDLCRKSQMIYLFNSEYWKLLEDEKVKDFLGDVSLKIGVPKFDAKLYTFKDDLFKQFISEARLNEIKPKSNTTLINLKNGTFEITPHKQELRGFKKEDFITYQLPFEYDEDATAPLFMMFINEVLPQQELQDVLSEYLGYIFTKNGFLKMEKVLLLYGTGANGKSVVFEIISALLGKQNISNYSLQSLTNDSGYYRAMLSSKLLNYASEINGKLEASLFKQLISGEPVEARLPYGKPLIISDYAKFMFNCNELPKEVENTNAFFRRFIILPFNVTIPPHKQDKELSQKIIDAELSGVFNWVMDGLKRLLKNKKFTNSTIVEDQVKQYQKESDSVAMFIDDNDYKKSNTEFRALSEIYQQYKVYADDNGYRRVSNRTLSKRLEGLGFEKERKTIGNCFYIQVSNSIDF